jgi:hypothetical protein
MFAHIGFMIVMIHRQILHGQHRRCTAAAVTCCSARLQARDLHVPIRHVHQPVDRPNNLRLEQRLRRARLLREPPQRLARLGAHDRVLRAEHVHDLRQRALDAEHRGAHVRLPRHLREAAREQRVLAPARDAAGCERLQISMPVRVHFQMCQIS